MDLPEKPAAWTSRVNQILDRIKELLEDDRDAALCAFFDRSTSGIANWRRRGSIDIELVIQRVEKAFPWVNLHWLLTGNGPKHALLHDDEIQVLATLTPALVLRRAAELVEKLEPKQTPEQVK